jgi:apolipoprotein N-acyltransferase
MVTIALSAFLASAAFAPIGVWYLGVIGYSLFLRKVSKSHRQLWHAFAFGFIYNAIVLHWTGKFVGAVPWLLLSFLQALFYIPVGVAAKRWGSIRLTIAALLIMEEIRSVFPFGGFGWTRIAFSQVESPASAILPYGGVLALSALTLLSAALIARIRVGNLVKLLLIVIGLGLIPANPQGSGSVKLLAIQGNTPSVGLDFNSRAQAVFNLHRDATYKYATGSYDAIVWPENAIDIDPDLYPKVAADIKGLTSQKQTPLIAGVVLKRDGSPVNASVMYTSESGAVSTYIKRGLTPFGEYMPLRGLAEFISPFAASVVDFKPGNELVTHKIADSALGPIICYEIINDRLVAEMSLNSAALIVQTNSATFAGTAESRQQLAITRIRALENSRSILSVSTIGISAFINSNGEVTQATSENNQTAMTGDLILNDHLTFANKWGNLVKLGVLFLIFIVGIRDIRRRGVV